MNNLCLTQKQEFLDVFESMIDYMVMYNEDVYTDDMIVDMTADPERRQEALDDLLDWMHNEYGYSVRIEK